ncbi:hypothetical protein DL98DRAFT_155999 [Cadophora sp. DSE1049]|nr:hypothetical protein DL98DRAFT_155999 [Cadophora sp. DSE1049]
MLNNAFCAQLGMRKHANGASNWQVLLLLVCLAGSIVLTIFDPANFFNRTPTTTAGSHPLSFEFHDFPYWKQRPSG